MIQRIIQRIKRNIRNKKFRDFKNQLHPTCNFGDHVDIQASIFSEEARVAHHGSIRSSLVGRFTSIGRYTKITHSEIGSFCSISWDATINAVTHPYNHLTVSAFPYVPHMGHFVNERKQTHQKVVIGHDVWIGANAVIMPGIKIGHGAIIGASAVVTKDVPPYAIVVGVPAKIIKYRFEPKIIERLLEIKWWDLDKKVIKDNISLFQGEFTEDNLKKLESLRNNAI